jgi:hypothetical protein
MRMYRVSLRGVWSVRVKADSGPEALQEARREIVRLMGHFEAHLCEISPECLESVGCEIERRGEVFRL